MNWAEKQRERALERERERDRVGKERSSATI